jgi:hypothetical protein
LLVPATSNRFCFINPASAGFFYAPDLTRSARRAFLVEVGSGATDLSLSFRL